jgi:hypothetical protein
MRAGDQYAGARGSFHDPGQTKGVVKQCPSVRFEAVVADVGLDGGEVESRN